MSQPADTVARRRFLRWLASSPLLALGGVPLSEFGGAPAGRPAPVEPSPQHLPRIQGDSVITRPEDAVNVFDFEPAARRALPPAHFGYLATGVDDDATLHANRRGFSRFQIRARRLVDVRKVDSSVTLFGGSWDTPIALAPVSSQRAFHPDGELAVARAARATGHLQILSTLASASIEDVTAARGAPVWHQLYPTNDWNVGARVVQRAQAAGAPVLVLTVDLQGGTNRETLARAERADARKCAMCHEVGNLLRGRARRPMLEGLDLSRVTALTPPDMTWDVIRRVRDLTSMRLVLKGIVTREDAELAVEQGVDGLIVSNHGGRAEESNRSTIESLPEVVEGVGGRIPILVDGGFRRGTDIFKALALGATAVCIGRPYCWGLAAFGQPGVEAVLGILRRELETIMRQAGTTAISRITRGHVSPAAHW